MNLPVKKPRRNQLHPWAEWFAKGAFHLVRGEHYACRTDSMAQAIRFKATELNFKAQVHIDEDGNGLTAIVTPDNRRQE